MDNWNIENFMIAGQAMWKMAGFFWPLILVAAVAMFFEWRKEVLDD